MYVIEWVLIPINFTGCYRMLWMELEDNRKRIKWVLTPINFTGCYGRIVIN
jgi:hypothetical protein